MCKLFVICCLLLFISGTFASKKGTKNITNFTHSESNDFVVDLAFFSRQVGIIIFMYFFFCSLCCCRNTKKKSVGGKKRKRKLEKIVFFVFGKRIQ